MIKSKKKLRLPNKKKEDYIPIFNKAMDFYHEKKYRDSIKNFEKIKHYKFPSHRFQYHLFLGMCYEEIKDYKRALFNAKKASKLNPANEMVSLSLYIVYVKSKKYKLAIKELDRYLSKFPANSYKVTLIELLWELKKGNATNYMDTILKYVRKNKVKIPW
jgi:tetratricopeptide (TPR) repeat protein